MNETELNELFEMAIGREVEAHEFYKAAAERVESASIKELFRQLSAEEKAHEELLWKLKADPTAMLTIKAAADHKVAETVELPAITLEMKPADAIALAMKKEQQAMELYQRLARWSEDDTTREMYESLAAMELNHKVRLEGLFLDVGYPEVW